MALMKMGRRGDPPTKKKGEDPKKKAAVQEVTVSAKKPETKDQKVKLEGATTSNIFYADIKDPVERNKAAQKYENDNYDKALKSGNMVSLSSVKTSNPKAYELLSNSMQPKKDSYGEIEDYLVDKKYANVSSYKDIYGYDYDPVERKKAAKEDKLDAFEKKMGGRTQYMPKSDFGYNIKYMTDEKLKEKFDKDPGKLPLLKAGPLPTKRGSLKEAPEKDKPEDWSIKKPSRFSGTSISYSAPSLNRSKAVKGEDNVKFGGGIKTDSGRFGVKKLAYAAVANPLQRVRFNKEVRQGKAYFGSNEGSTSGDLATKRSDLKSDKADYKTSIKEVRKGKVDPGASLTKSERIRGYRAEIGTINKDLRTTNKASRYLKDLGQPSANSKITEYKTSAGDVKKINTGKIQYATPGDFAGYADSPQNKRVDKLANLRINPANRNTIELQLKTNKKSSNKLKN